MPLPPSAQQIVGAIPMPAGFIGSNERLTFANAPFADLFGDDFSGRHFVTAIRQPAIITAIETVLNGAPAAQASFDARRGAQTANYDVLVRAADDGALVTFLDQTETQTTERMRSDFIANVSHELRTPLTALMGFTETLRGAARNDEKARDRFLGIMEQEAGRMMRLVDELMTLTKLESIERMRPKAQILLMDVIVSATDGVLPIAKRANVTLNVTSPPDPITLSGDAAQLQQVFTNLIENALKYGAKGGRVDVSIDEITQQPQLRGLGAKVTVRDYGEGIAAHHIPRLTERFYRVDSHRSRQIGGTGLGLAIVKHIISRHRGHFKIESELGQGTAISVILPL